jgi:hypothetical protein
MNESTPPQPALADKTRTLYLVCGLLMLFILGFDLAIPLGVAMGVFYVVPVLITLWAPRKSFTLAVAVFATILTVACFFYKPPAGELWKVIFNRSISVFAIWVTAILGLQRKTAVEKQEEAVQEREKALEEVKILRGSLPICSYCKKIRNDSGAWTQMEAYIRDHSEAEFSHGLCPDCAKKVYQELLEGKEPEDVY